MGLRAELTSAQVMGTMPLPGHRNSPSPDPVPPMEPIVLQDGSLSPRAGAAGSLPVVNRPHCKHGPRGSVANASGGKSEPDIDGESLLPIKVSDAVVENPTDDDINVELKSPHTPKVADKHKQDDGGSTTINNDGKSVMEDVHRLLETLSPFADVDEAWGQSKPD